MTRNIIVPTAFKKHREKLFVAQMFVINDAGGIVSACMYPQPTNGQINGAFLSQIEQNLSLPIQGLLQQALQNGEAKVMFRITELDKFLAEKAKVDTLNALRAKQNATAKPEKKGATDD